MKFKMIVVVCWLNVYEGKIDLEIPELFVSKHFTSFIALWIIHVVSGLVRATNFSKISHYLCLLVFVLFSFFNQMIIVLNLNLVIKPSVFYKFSLFNKLLLSCVNVIHIANNRIFLYYNKILTKILFSFHFYLYCHQNLYIDMQDKLK